MGIARGANISHPVRREVKRRLAEARLGLKGRRRGGTHQLFDYLSHRFGERACDQEKTQQKDVKQGARKKEASRDEKKNKGHHQEGTRRRACAS